MEKEFVPYELSLELKQLGFDEPCFAYYSYDGDYILGIDEVRFDTISTYDQNSNLAEDSNACSAPLYQQAFRWFRERYQLVHEIQFGSGKIWIRYGYNSFVRALEVDSNNNEFYHTYEEAELACLQKLIEIVKTK
jgi:hypothetical protein